MPPCVLNDFEVILIVTAADSTAVATSLDLIATSLDLIAISLDLIAISLDLIAITLDLIASTSIICLNQIPFVIAPLQQECGDGYMRLLFGCNHGHGLDS